MARILIIDDDDSFRRALAESIQDCGHDAVEVSNPQYALELIGRPDVTFLDLKMPGMSASKS